MHLFLDTEFNGHGGELISMALIGLTCKWYQAQIIKGPINQWVKDNVLPKLGTPQLPPADFRRYFHNWIRQYDNPNIFCDWHTDAEHFCRMLAGPDYGSSLDFACQITILKTPPGQPISVNQHNALADAEALMNWYECLNHAL